MSTKQRSINKTTTILFIVTILMFGFGYAMVPLYDAFCQITGLNGKTQRVTEGAGGGITNFRSRGTCTF